MLLAPFDPIPDFDVETTVEDSEEEGVDVTGLSISLGVMFGVGFIMVTVIFCCICARSKPIRKCLGGCCENTCDCFVCCIGGCLSFLKLFDIRRYFGNEDNGYVNNIVYLV